MLIMMKANYTSEMLDVVVNTVESLSYQAHVLPGEHSLAIGVTGNKTSGALDKLSQLPGVERVIRVSSPYKLAGRSFRPEDTVYDIHGVKLGAGHFTVIAGPCAVESEEQTLRIAREVKERGAHMLRGGAYKPRTSPYSFHGMGIDGLKILKTAREETGLAIVTEALDPQSLAAVYDYADVIQIGTRNMQNFALLREAGQLDKPVLLKRGMSATLEEWLMAAEYILSEGNSQVILCERGLRHYDKHTRNILDLGAVLAVKKLSHLPVVIDPSHSLGHRSMVLPASQAALAIGAHGLLIDVHDRPAEALCDGPQAISPDELSELMGTLNQMGPILGAKL